MVAHTAMSYISSDGMCHVLLPSALPLVIILPTPAKQTKAGMLGIFRLLT